MSFKPVYGEPFMTHPVRLQYVNLEEVDTGHKFSRENYNVRGLISKDDKTVFKQILKACKEVAGVASVDDLEKHPFLDDKGKIKDGDNEKHAKKEGHAGHYFFVATSNAQPECYIFEKGMEEAERCDPGDIYSGCFASLLLVPCEYEEGSVTVYLKAVVKTADGKPFTAAKTSTKALINNWMGGKPSVKKSKDEDEDDAPPKKKKRAVVDEEDDEDEKPVTKKKKVRAPEPDDDEDEPEVDDEEEEDEVEETPKKKRGRPKGSTNKKPTKGSIHPKHTRSDDEDEEEEDDEDEKPVAKKAKKVRESEPEEDDEDEEEEQPKKKRSSVEDILDD